MTKLLEIARARLERGNAVCVVVNSLDRDNIKDCSFQDSMDGDFIEKETDQSRIVIDTSDQRGIRPIMDWIKDKPYLLDGASVADRVVGKAAAFLMIHGHVRDVYAELISEPAAACFDTFQIPYSFGRIVPRILNREGTSMCPMESCCLEIYDPQTAYTALQARLEEMQNS